MAGTRDHASEGVTGWTAASFSFFVLVLALALVLVLVLDTSSLRRGCVASRLLEGRVSSSTKRTSG